jgi:uncharacterized membrane protein
MNLHALDWTQYLMRCGHVLAAIFWMGRLVFFLINKTSEGTENWIELGDGFYQLEKKNIGPGSGPKPGRLRTDILLTWLSGVCLLILVYYLNINSHSTALVSNIFPGAGTVFGIGGIILSWLVYDVIWTQLGLSHPKWALALTFLLLSSCAFGFCEIFVGPAGFIHFGSMLGTWMIANAWIRGVPVRRKMAIAAQSGETVDETLMKSTRLRSTHNTYLAFPVLFLMLSIHFPVGYTARFSSVILVCIFLLGLSVCHALTKRNANPHPALAAVVAFSVLIIAAPAIFPITQKPATTSAATPVTFKQVQSIVNQRCVTCHSANPTIVQVGASSVPLDTPEQIKRLAERINARTVVMKTMPPNNQTGMTDEERDTIRRWFAQGAAEAY